MRSGPCSRPGELGTRGVVLTFDDAWADNHANALGPLSRHGLPAMLYAPSRLLGRSGYMTRSQLLEMDAGGVTIGAHSRNHPDLRACSPHELESEIRGSKEDLEDLLGKPVTSFAYPTGLLDDRVVEAVRAAASRRPSPLAPDGGARGRRHYEFLVASPRTSPKVPFGLLSEAASMSLARLTRSSALAPGTAACREGRLPVDPGQWRASRSHGEPGR